jgi:peptidoglycan/xylan/chitin deacetylase (PgdA/CDA1 family)
MILPIVICFGWNYNIHCYLKMKRVFFLSLVLLLAFFVGAPLYSTIYAQTSSATPSAIALLPTLFPTITPTPAGRASWPILPQFDDLASPSAAASISATATTSAITPPLTPDYASDYCLDVPIVMYHHVEPMDIATQLGHPQLTEDNSYFEDHIKYLSEHNYHFITLEELVHAIVSHGSVPEKSVVITLDDGYIDNYTYAFLTAKKYHALMNFMIPTGLVGQPDYLTWDHLKEMAQSPYVSIYNHTTSHAALGLISQDEIIKEVTTANDDLKNNLGITNDIVIYPYGSYSDLAIQTLQQLGMIAAVSTDPGEHDCVSNIMKLPRVRVGNAPISEYGF